MIHLRRTTTIKHHGSRGAQIIDVHTEEIAVSAHKAMALLARDEGWEMFDLDERKKILRECLSVGNFAVHSTGWIEGDIADRIEASNDKNIGRFEIPIDWPSKDD